MLADDEVVDQRREHVHEQDGQHHALGIGGVDHADEHHEHADAERRSRACPSIVKAERHRVRRHEHHPEGPAAEHDVPPEGHGEHRVRVGSEGSSGARHGAMVPEHDARHRLPRAPILVTSRITIPKQTGRGRGLPHRAGDEAVEGVRTSSIRLEHAGPWTAAWASHVAPVKESTCPKSAAIQGASPRDLRGIGEKEEGARGEGGVQEVHPRAAEDLLADDRPKAVRRAPPCHNGIVGGSVSGSRNPVTKKPSLTSCLRMHAPKIDLDDAAHPRKHTMSDGTK